MKETIGIVPFRPDLATAFAELNREWIERLFRLEEADRKVLRDPESAIIGRGGQIFFALDGATAAGTAAAIRVAPAVYELAKMAVAPAYQGRGLGERLGRAVIDWAQSAGAARLFLETNSSLKNASRLYERLGFRHVAHPAPSEYVRSDVYMELVF
jgi:GNAT superfamily N-acetyltransferase